MKKLLIGAGSVAVIAIAVVLRFVLFPVHSQQKNSLAMAAAGTKTFSALVTPIAHRVFAMAPNPSGQAFAELATSTRVQTGTRIKTSNTGRAIIEGGHDAFLDFNAEVVVASGDASSGSHIQLETGKTWSRVKKVFDKGEFYELEHYPKDDVFDGETYSQYYYHAHRAGTNENGHFHTFLRQPGIPTGISP